MQPTRSPLFDQRTVIQRLVFFIYVVLITLLSLLPGSDLPSVKLFRHADKLVHMCMYAGFTFLLLRGWPRFFRGSLQWLPLFLVLFWGMTMEILQDLGHYGRSFEISDIAANVSGFFPGWFAWRVLRWYKQRKG